MKVYHGSLVVVEAPQIIAPTPGHNCDFGSGFYTTTSNEQAQRWVRLRLNQNKDLEQGYISVFEIPDDILTNSTFKTLVFPEADASWLRFVIENRNNDSGLEHDYDIVAGPVANDRVYASIALFEGGLLSEEETIKRLKTYRLVDQILFHTQRALDTLRFIQYNVIR